MPEPEEDPDAVVQQEESPPSAPTEPEEPSAPTNQHEESPPDAEKPSAPTAEPEDTTEEPPPPPPPKEESPREDPHTPADGPEVQNATEHFQLRSAESKIQDNPPDESIPVKEETQRRRSSGKRASIGAPSKTMSINQETFMPPEVSTPLPGSGDRRVSGIRRTSIPASDAKRASSARKSRFGMLSSKARMVLGSIVDIKSNTAEGYDKKVARYQNTYKMESDKPFNYEKVDKILKEVMHEVLENLQYDPEKCASTARHASSQIRSKVKQLEFDRYKLVSIVSIGEKNSQDVYATCRFLWDPEKDRYSFYSLENTHVYGIAFCFGLYYE